MESPTWIAEWVRHDCVGTVTSVRGCGVFLFFGGLFFFFRKTPSFPPCRLAAGVSGLRRQPISALSHAHESDAAVPNCAQHPLLLWLLPPFNFTSNIFVMHSESHTAATEHLHFFLGRFECASNALTILSVHIMHTLHPELIARHQCLVDVL